MKLRLAVASLCAIAITGAPALAQVPPGPVLGVQTTFNSGSVSPDAGVTASGPTGSAYYVGPYSGSITLGGTTIPVVFNCVDFFHDVTNGEVWTSALVNLGSGIGVGSMHSNSLTRLYGDATFDTDPGAGITNVTVSALDVYRAAAYLISTYPNPASSNGPGTIAIQDEIWQMTSMFYPQLQGETSTYESLDPTPGVTDGAGTTRTDGYSFGAPVTAAQLASDIYDDSHKANFDYSQYWVVTTSDPGSDAASSPQEFIMHQTTSTPEPGTLVLFGSGMFGVVGGGFFRRRRRKNGA